MTTAVDADVAADGRRRLRRRRRSEPLHREYIKATMFPVKSRITAPLIAVVALLAALSFSGSSSFGATAQQARGGGGGDGDGNVDVDVGGAANNDDDSAAAAAAAANGDAAKPDIAERGSKGSSSSSSSSSSVALRDPTLDSDSVVLITGAAGFIGSELALALRRTYGVARLLLVDDLGITSEADGMYVPPPPPPDGGDGGGGTRPVYEKLTEEELGLFEMKRQRAFRIFHELTSPPLTYGDDGDDENGEGGNSGNNDNDDVESVRFYRADMRPSIPEFFDFGELPLLEGIFQSNPDITHVVHLAGELRHYSLYPHTSWLHS